MTATRKPGGESAFQEQVMQLARFYGWLVAHFHDSRREVVRRGQRVVIGDRDAAGFPDLVLVRGPEIIFAELKAEKGRLSEAQEQWITALQVVADASPAVDVYIWRPSHFDELHARLAHGRHVNQPLYRTGAND